MLFSMTIGGEHGEAAIPYVRRELQDERECERESNVRSSGYIAFVTLVPTDAHVMAVINATYDRSKWSTALRSATVTR